MTFHFEFVLHHEVHLKNADDVVKLEQEVEDLKEQVHKKDVECQRLAQFGALNLRYIDSMKAAEKIMKEAGLDTSCLDFRSEGWMRDKVTVRNL